MSTRSTTWFTDGDQPIAKVYRHADGYPEGHGVELQHFFADVETQTADGMGGTRFSDPSYLAAKLIVWLAGEFASTYDSASGEYVSHRVERPLDFLSVGVVQDDPGDVEYVYVVDCGELDTNNRPTVTCHKRGGDYNGPVTLGEVVEIPAAVAS